MTSRAESLALREFSATNLSIPVDLEVIAKNHSSRIYYEDLEEDVSGMLLTSVKSCIIVVNANHHKHRQRFTIAHECGHLIMHREEKELFVDSKRTAKMFYRNAKSSTGEDIKEREANEFASYLLMPTEPLKEAANSLSMDSDDEMAVKVLASKFDVSIQAMSIRLTKLGLAF